MFGDEVSCLIFDLGSFNCRVGYAGDDLPRCVLQQSIGIGKSEECENYFFGESDLRFYKEDIMVRNVVGPSGFIENNDLFEKLSDHVFDDILCCDPKEMPILFSEPNIHNKEMRCRLTETIFEKYGIPAIYICKSAVLTAFSLGRSTCVVLDSGHYSTTSTPVHDGYAIQKSLIKHDIGGSYLTNELLKLVEGKGISIFPHYKIRKNIIDSQSFVEYIKTREDPSYELFWKKEIIRDMKENLLSFGEDSKQSVSYELPDGKMVELTEERTGFLEKFFQPNKEFPNYLGIHQMVIDSINKGDIDLKKELYSNIIITGGNTLFPYFPERIQKQIHSGGPPNVKVKVTVAPTSLERKFSSWIGGSILTSVGNFHQLWFSKQEYEEHGAVLIERKCP